jgi:hypothetical protein
MKHGWLRFNKGVATHEWGIHLMDFADINKANSLSILYYM